MTRLRPVFSVALPVILAACAVAPLSAQGSGDADMGAETGTAEPTKGEARLAKLLKGRVAGEPVRCIRALPSQRMTTIPGTAYVFGSGNTIYVQRTRDPAQIDRNDTLVSNRFNASEICRLEQRTTVDRLSGIFTGVVFFEDFVPYTRSEGDAG